MCHTYTAAQPYLGYYYLGCYGDGGAYRALPGPYQDGFIVSSVDECAWYAYNNGYMFFGIEAGAGEPLLSIMHAVSFCLRQSCFKGIAKHFDI